MEEDRGPAIGSTTLRVYLELLSGERPMGVREMQRRMNFRSPSTSKYHLDRLVAAGLAEKTRDGLYVAKRGDTLITALFTSLMGIILPRIMLYATFITSSLLIYVLLTWPSVDLASLTFGIISALIMWVEGARLLKMLGRLRSKEGSRARRR